MNHRPLGTSTPGVAPALRGASSNNTPNNTTQRPPITLKRPLGRNVFPPNLRPPPPVAATNTASRVFVRTNESSAASRTVPLPTSVPNNNLPSSNNSHATSVSGTTTTADRSSTNRAPPPPRKKRLENNYDNMREENEMLKERLSNMSKMQAQMEAQLAQMASAKPNVVPTTAATTAALAAQKSKQEVNASAASNSSDVVSLGAVQLVKSPAPPVITTLKSTGELPATSKVITNEQRCMPEKLKTSTTISRKPSPFGKAAVRKSPDTRRPAPRITSGAETRTPKPPRPRPSRKKQQPARGVVLTDKKSAAAIATNNETPSSSSSINNKRNSVSSNRNNSNNNSIVQVKQEHGKGPPVTIEIRNYTIRRTRQSPSKLLAAAAAPSSSEDVTATDANNSNNRQDSFNSSSTPSNSVAAAAAAPSATFYMPGSVSPPPHAAPPHSVDAVADATSPPQPLLPSQVSRSLYDDGYEHESLEYAASTTAATTAALDDGGKPRVINAAELETLFRELDQHLDDEYGADSGIVDEYYEQVSARVNAECNLDEWTTCLTQQTEEVAAEPLTHDSIIHSDDIFANDSHATGEKQTADDENDDDNFYAVVELVRKRKSDRLSEERLKEDEQQQQEISQPVAKKSRRNAAAAVRRKAAAKIDPVDKFIDTEIARLERHLKDLPTWEECGERPEDVLLRFHLLQEGNCVRWGRVRGHVLPVAHKLPFDVAPSELRRQDGIFEAVCHDLINVRKAQLVQDFQQTLVHDQLERNFHGPSEEHYVLLRCAVEKLEQELNVMREQQYSIDNAVYQAYGPYVPACSTAVAAALPANIGPPPLDEHVKHYADWFEQQYELILQLERDQQHETSAAEINNSNNEPVSRNFAENASQALLVKADSIDEDMASTPPPPLLERMAETPSATGGTPAAPTASQPSFAPVTVNSSKNMANAVENIIITRARSSTGLSGGSSSVAAAAVESRRESAASNHSNVVMHHQSVAAVAQQLDYSSPSSGGRTSSSAATQQHQHQQQQQQPRQQLASSFSIRPDSQLTSAIFQFNRNITSASAMNAVNADDDDEDSDDSLPQLQIQDDAEPTRKKRRISFDDDDEDNRDDAVERSGSEPAPLSSPEPSLKRAAGVHTEPTPPPPSLPVAQFKLTLKRTNTTAAVVGDASISTRTRNRRNAVGGTGGSTSDANVANNGWSVAAVIATPSSSAVNKPRAFERQQRGVKPSPSTSSIASKETTGSLTSDKRKIKNSTAVSKRFHHRRRRRRRRRHESGAGRHNKGHSINSSAVNKRNNSSASVESMSGKSNNDDCDDRICNDDDDDDDEIQSVDNHDHDDDGDATPPPLLMPMAGGDAAGADDADDGFSKPPPDPAAISNTARRSRSSTKETDSIIQQHPQQQHFANASSSSWLDSVFGETSGGGRNSSLRHHHHQHANFAAAVASHTKQPNGIADDLFSRHHHPGAGNIVDDDDDAEADAVFEALMGEQFDLAAILPEIDMHNLLVTSSSVTPTFGHYHHHHHTGGGGGSNGVNLQENHHQSLRDFGVTPSSNQAEMISHGNVFVAQHHQTFTQQSQQVFSFAPEVHASADTSASSSFVIAQPVLHTTQQASHVSLTLGTMPTGATNLVTLLVPPNTTMLMQHPAAAVTAAAEPPLNAANLDAIF